jgi:hypothetical protein
MEPRVNSQFLPLAERWPITALEINKPQARISGVETSRCFKIQDSNTGIKDTRSVTDK